MSLLPYFPEKLKSAPDGDGNLLDRSLVLFDVESSGDSTGEIGI